MNVHKAARQDRHHPLLLARISLPHFEIGAQGKWEPDCPGYSQLCSLGYALEDDAGQSDHKPSKPGILFKQRQIVFGVFVKRALVAPKRLVVALLIASQRKYGCHG